MSKSIKLMTDYFSSPLWWTGDKVGNIDPKTLPLSNNLVQVLVSWAEKYNTTL